jgi:hypothetical protein
VNGGRRWIRYIEGVYTQEFREQAVKLVEAEGLLEQGGRPAAVDTAGEREELGAGDPGGHAQGGGHSA